MQQTFSILITFFVCARPVAKLANTFIRAYLPNPSHFELGIDNQNMLFCIGIVWFISTITRQRSTLHTPDGCQEDLAEDRQRLVIIFTSVHAFSLANGGSYFESRTRLASYLIDDMCTCEGADKYYWSPVSHRKLLFRLQCNSLGYPYSTVNTPRD